jgi:hypothetical protein
LWLRNADGNWLKRGFAVLALGIQRLQENSHPVGTGWLWIKADMKSF